MRRLALTRLVRASGVILALCLCGCAYSRWQFAASPPPGGPAQTLSTNAHVTPTGQLLAPAGYQVELPGMRPQALALSPDGTLLAVAGGTKELVLVNPANGRILQKLPLTTTRTELKSDAKPAAGLSGSTNTISVKTTVTNTAEMSLTGLVFSPDSRHVYLSDTAGHVWMFPADTRFAPARAAMFTLPDVKGASQKRDIPSGLAVSADGRRLYVAGNLGNRLHEMDARSGKVLRSWDTGFAPYDVALAGSKAYVSNLGGRRPGKGDVTAPAGKGTKVRVDPVRHIADEGSVTIIDLAAGKVTAEILTGLHASAVAVSPNGAYVVVANAGSDTLTVIDTRADRIIEKIWARQTPADPFGAQPNALAFDRSGRRLYVCNTIQNAVAVVEFEPEDNASKVAGLIPTAWFPAAIQVDHRRQTLFVANMRGLGSAKVFKADEKVKLQTRTYFGTVSVVPAPSEARLAELTTAALHNMRYSRLQEAALPARPGQPARPVPERVGEPSVFKHVVYVIKENRTYDQVLGDMPEGNGDPSLCTFGERYTPNQHKIAREFVLLDNTYCAGICSSDGHQWTSSALANEYVERQITSGTPRSYTGAKAEDAVDALSWASSGFIWDNALARGKTFRNYGEWMFSEAGWRDRKKKDKINWKDFWQDHQTGAGRTRLRSRPLLEGLRKHSNTNTVGWDLKVPDVMRAAEFIRDLRRYETNGGFPNLVLIFLPNDHTGGSRNEYPTPGAQVADNDLAFGQIVEAISHSRFWPETCIFAIEDDPQAGWDHVSGYRTTAYVVSPYTQRKLTVSTHYNQTSLIRTMELMLGLPPMNQLDATATPMTDCFTATPDFTPFVAVPNIIPLDQMNPEPAKIADHRLRQDALVSARLPLEEVDRCPEDLFNRILWRAMKGPDTPYPEWAVKLVDDEDDD
jgi:YVTN family beta-propeller protein